jgi:uncharacterized protein YbgA (DUF1722 family)
MAVHDEAFAGRPVRIGIAACLFGDHFLTGIFGRHAEWVPGVDRLAVDDLCGYVVKKHPSTCGVERARVGGGRLPWLPVEEESRLSDPCLRENFVERVFAYGRLRKLFGAQWTLNGLVRFHTSHKLILLAHSAESYRRLGRLVAQAATVAPPDLEHRYGKTFMSALRQLATPRRHANVLQHVAGYFKDRLDRNSRRELLGVIDEYRRELVPLVVPLTLLRHHVRARQVAYLAGQLYLEPYPWELMLRHHLRP